MIVFMSCYIIICITKQGHTNHGMHDLLVSYCLLYSHALLLPPDLCTLGFHPCDGNATCQWEEVSDQVTCSCLEGFTGSGVECQPLQCECDGDNMVCGSAVDTGGCVCAEGYTLSEAGVCVLQSEDSSNCSLSSIPHDCLLLTATQCSQFVNGAVTSVTVVGNECVSQEVKDLVEQVPPLMCSTGPHSSLVCL